MKDRTIIMLQNKRVKYFSAFFGGIALSIFGSVTVFAAFTPSDWQYKRVIELRNQSDFAKVILPHDLSKVNRSFADVRIINQSGEEAPYLLTRGLSYFGGEIQARMLNTGSLNGRTHFIADTGAQGIVHTGISIKANSQNFQRQISIYASQTLLPQESSNWTLITDKGYIFKFTDPVTGFTSGEDTVNFPANTARYFKIVIGSGDEGPIAVSGATIYGEVERNIPIYIKNVPVTIFNNPQRKSTEVTADLEEEGLLTHGITIYSPDKNYSRKVVIESSTDKVSWSYISEGSISSVQTSLFEGTSTHLDYPEQNTRYIRVSIINNDNQPLTIEGKADIEGVEVGAIFKTTPGESYALYYGNPEAVSPLYDISRIASYIEENTIPEALLQEEMMNPAYNPPKEPSVPFTEKYPWLLNTLLAVVIITIGVCIALYFKKYLKDKKTGGFEDTRL